MTTTRSRLSCIIALLALALGLSPEGAARSRGEYFWNNDPGIGHGKALNEEGTADGFSIFTLDAREVKAGGLNILGLRAFEGRRWSQTQTYVIMVPEDPAEAIWSAEYFWDEDPGVGKATALAIAPGAGGAVSFELTMSGLAPGQHTLGVRTNAGRSWSQTLLSTVFVPQDYHSNVIAAEYFWGDDPGYGKGTPIKLTEGAEVEISNLTLDFPAETAKEYALSFRARSEYGWGQTVTKVIPHLYVEKIEVSADKDWLAQGETLPFKATLTPEDAFVDAVTWTTSDASVATVDTRGNVKGTGCGTATITATSTDGTDIAGSMEVRVLNPVRSLTVSPSELTIDVSRKAKLTATASPADATDREVVWSIDDPKIASVDADGTVTALKPGNATVTVTAADGCGASAQCSITVTILGGDADGSGTLSVNDVVLTARAVVDDIDSKLVTEAVDFNADGSISVGDLTNTVEAVMNWTPGSTVNYQARMAPRIGSIDAEINGADVKLTFDGIGSYSGVQFDVIAPEGLNVEQMQLSDISEGHSTAVTRLSAATSRAMAYGNGNFPVYTASAAFATLRLLAEQTLAPGEYELTFTNVYASDYEGNLYALDDLTVRIAYSSQSGLYNPENAALNIRSEGHKVIVESPVDTVIMLSDMHGIGEYLDIHTGHNEFYLPTPGVYIVNGLKIIIR